MKCIKTLQPIVFTIMLTFFLGAIQPVYAVYDDQTFNNQDHFVGEIVMFAGSIPPRNWVFCHGQYLWAGDYYALWQLIGNTYGGESYVFAAPDLRGRVPIGAGGPPLGQMSGTESQTLTVEQLPSHHHRVMVHPSEGTDSFPEDSYLGKTGDGAPDFYRSADGPPTGEMATDAISNTGASQPISIMQPSTAINYIICVRGYEPVLDYSN